MIYNAILTLRHVDIRATNRRPDVSVHLGATDTRDEVWRLCEAWKRANIGGSIYHVIRTRIVSVPTPVEEATNVAPEPKLLFACKIIFQGELTVAGNTVSLEGLSSRDAASKMARVWLDSHAPLGSRERYGDSFPRAVVIVPMTTKEIAAEDIEPQLREES